MSGPTMTLFPYVFPHVRPGVYRVDSTQTMTGGGLTAADTLPARSHHIEVTAPRFAMPGTEVFGVFPPPHANGPFAGRLAQIVLRSRSLPWDRSIGVDQPWLALVVLASDEATFLPDVAASEAYTAGRTPPGVPTDARCAAIEVPRAVVSDAFPAADELDLLAHVRRVNTVDTEYADRDGWVSVLIANRLPLAGRAYGAYLISLEGQIDTLPDAGQVEGGVVKDWVFADLIVDAAAIPRAEAPLVVTGAPTDTARPTYTFAAHDARAAAVTSTTFTATTSSTSRWVAHDVDFTRFVNEFDIDPVLLEPFRFPVLAHWDFTCSDEEGDFAGYMSNLDVGLLGTAPLDDPRGGVVPVAVSGHVAIEHTDRRGDAGTAWYRGPCTPSKISRIPAGRPYHVADQARRIGTDGREDVSYAAAFEVGRLLAMSDMQFLRGLRSWVRRELALRRRTDALGPHLVDLGIDAVLDTVFGRTVTRDVLVPGGIGGDPRIELGTPLVLHEAVDLYRPRDKQVLATGLDVQLEIVEQVLGGALATRPVDVAVLDHKLNTFEEIEQATHTLGALRGELDGFAAAIDAQADRAQADSKAGVAGPIIERLTGGTP